MVYETRSEQGFGFRTHGCEWKVKDFDGIKLLLRPANPSKAESSLRSANTTTYHRREASIDEDDLLFITINGEEDDRIVECCGIDTPECSFHHDRDDIKRLVSAIGSKILVMGNARECMMELNDFIGQSGPLLNKTISLRSVAKKKHPDLPSYSVDDIAGACNVSGEHGPCLIRDIYHSLVRRSHSRNEFFSVILGSIFIHS